jgi:hypothetical protein
MRLLIALDIDGVLNSGADNARLYELVTEQGLTYQDIHNDPQLPYRFIDRGNFVNTNTLKQFQVLVEELDGDVVGISSWFGSRHDVWRIAEFLGVRILDKVKDTGGGEGRVRALGDYITIMLPERLLVLDDQWSSYREYGMMPHHVQPTVGLTDADFKRAREIASLPIDHERMALLRRVNDLRRTGIRNTE